MMIQQNKNNILSLNSLVNNYGAKKDRKRVGRGIGSGKGKTCGKGGKGQKARAGVSIRSFEGGQTPLIKRLAKRGFNKFRSIKYQIINLALIDKLIDEKKINPSVEINKFTLLDLRIIKNIKKPVKLLSDFSEGDKFSKKIKINFDKYSEAAKNIILKAGGEISNLQEKNES